MLFHGMEKFSLVDYDGYVACTLFTGKCNFRCPFCHNASLVLSPENEPSIKIDEILKYLESRRGILDAVCITGGEPTLYSDLPDFIRHIKALGLKVKLDTNGSSPAMLEYLVESALVDYIAMDIKNSPDMYCLTTGIGNPPTKKVFDSASFLVSKGSSAGVEHGKFDYEFRTTLVCGHHTADDFVIIGNMLRGASKYFLQKFEDKGNCIHSGLSAVSYEQALAFAEILREYIPRVSLRGYDNYDNYDNYHNYHKK